MPQDPTPPDPALWSLLAEAQEGAAQAQPLDTRAWVLVRYVGQPMGQVLAIPEEGLTVGRAPENDLCLPEPEVSRRHARLSVGTDGAAVQVEDLGSVNGVYVNGRRVVASPAPHPLAEGDVVRVGAHAFKLKHMDALERQYHQVMAARTTLDPLTGICNRATVLRQLESSFELSRRHERPLAVILGDLDQFKRINDQHGHAAGDRVLEAFGAFLKGRLRASDTVGRIGGEEFLAVLPETSADLARTVAEDLRAGLAAQTTVLADGQGVRVTCSFGVAELKPGDEDAGALLARADAALYKAKSGGRDRVASAP